LPRRDLLEALSTILKPVMASHSKRTFAERAKQHPNVLVRRLLDIAERKKTNIVLSADLTTTDELLKIADGRSHRMPQR
jgi:hypothetical protein